ncbi:MAG: carbamoyl phosphate synthase small subunit [Gammaproteobacteria bacterium RIFCSPHIGHO2_12_FULL_45_9]|nr:MAG: carbamoyl phosphate synthase small subunit [Gammaproteobacteria bacterium RIFCSPHIGHO2_12_FULL_45_9]
MGCLKELQPAVLALADGSIFQGVSIGAEGSTVGEVVFNTAMTGYQEILTDPSYTEQIVTLTYPHIGNVGVNPFDRESHRAWAAGLIVREVPWDVPHWRATQSLSEFLRAEGVVAIAGIDTRHLTRILRDTGAQSGAIVTGTHDATEALSKAQAFPGLAGLDLAKRVTTSTIQEWTEGTWDLSTNQPRVLPAPTCHVVVYDFGVKWQILRLLADRGCRVTCVPAETPAETVLALQPDGIVLSNGPGDPAACTYAILATRRLLQTDIPIFGICLGFQILALAMGGRTFKMKFGHHGANHPVYMKKTGGVGITSQNHGFAVEAASLPVDCVATDVSLFDDTLQGFMHKTRPIFAFQGHPEASPGPRDVITLFDRFMETVHEYTAQCVKE